MAIGCHHPGNQVPELKVCLGQEPNLPPLPAIQGMVPDSEAGKVREIPFQMEYTIENIKRFIANNMPSYS